MIDETPATIRSDLSVRSKVLRIPVTDSEQLRAIYELPPLSEILAIQSLSSEKISLDETMETFTTSTKDGLYEEFLRLKGQADLVGQSSTYLNRLAVLLEKVGRPAEAEGYLSKAVKQSPNDPYLRSRLAIVGLKKDLNSDAIYELEKVAADGDIHSNLNLSLAWMFRRDLSKAISVADRIVAMDPLSYDARLLRGSLRLVSGRPELALRDLRVALEERPNSAVAYSNMGVAYLLLRNMEKALSAVRRANLIDPVDRNIVALLSDMYEATGKVEKSIPILSGYLEFDQKEADIWDRLAKAYYILGRHNEAMRTLQNEASVQDDHAVWNNMALVAWANGESDKASRLFSHAFSKLGKAEESEALVANYFEFLDATAQYSTLLEIASPIIRQVSKLRTRDNVYPDRIFLAYISALQQLRRTDEAAAEAEEYLSRQEEYTLPAINMVNFLLFHYTIDTKNESKARFYASRALELLNSDIRLPTKPRLRLMNNLAYTYVELGMLEDAKRYFATVRPHIEQDPFFLATQGLILFRQGDWRDGLVYYKRAVDFSKSHRLRQQLSQKMHLEAARSFVARGDTRSARSEYIRVLQIKNGSTVFDEEAKQEVQGLSGVLRQPR